MAIVRKRHYTLDAAKVQPWIHDWIYDAALSCGLHTKQEVKEEYTNPWNPFKKSYRIQYAIDFLFVRPGADLGVSFDKLSVLVAPIFVSYWHQWNPDKLDAPPVTRILFTCSNADYLKEFDNIISDFEFKLSYVRQELERSSPQPPIIQTEGDQINLVLLRQILELYFSRDELRTLCFDMGIDHENLPEQKAAMARELISHCQRADRLAELVNKCRTERPHAPW